MTEAKATLDNLRVVVVSFVTGSESKNWLLTDDALAFAKAQLDLHGPDGRPEAARCWQIRVCPIDQVGPYWWTGGKQFLQERYVGAETFWEDKAYIKALNDEESRLEEADERARARRR